MNPKCLPSVLGEPVMVMGADVTHAAPQHQGGNLIDSRLFAFNVLLETPWAISTCGSGAIRRSSSRPFLFQGPSISGLSSDNELRFEM